MAQTWKRLSPQRNERLDAAISCYIRRQNRKSHPVGYFDRASRWFPSDKERQLCCEKVHPPSASQPNSLNLHCRSLRHIARIYQVDPLFLSRRVSKMRNDLFRDIRAANQRRRNFRYPRPGGDSPKPPAPIPGAPAPNNEELDDLLKEIDRLVGKGDNEWTPNSMTS